MEQFTIPDPHCPAYLMEADWVEGFQCTRPEGHEGPHRCDADQAPDVLMEVNESADKDGHRYRWSYEWAYVDEQATGQ